MKKINISDEIYRGLVNIGLNDKEIAVYITCLELGPTNVQSIAKATGIKRVTVYTYLETLKQKGFIAETKRGNKRLIVAEEPESIQIIFERKKNELKSLEKGLPEIIKDLNSLKKITNTENKTSIRFYEGAKGILKVYDEIFQNYKEIRTWANISNIYKFLPPNTLDEQIKTFKKKGISIKEILEDTKEAREYIKKKGASATSKVLPPKYKFPLPTDLLIYEDNIAMISAKGTPTAVVMNKTEIAYTLSGIFDIMWSLI